MDWQGLAGFLPASQLKAEHYPRVNDGDKDRILEELRKLVGTKLTVSMIGAQPKRANSSSARRASMIRKKKELIANYQVGDVVMGEVTGMVDFGAFFKIEEGLEAWSTFLK